MRPTRRRATIWRSVRDVSAEHAQGAQRDEAGREDPAQPRALQNESRAVQQLQRRFPGRRAGSAGDERAGHVRPAGAGLCAGGAGQIPQATEPIRRSARSTRKGDRSWRRAWAIVAIYEGPLLRCRTSSDAGRRRRPGGERSDRAAAKFAALGYARLQRGKKGPAAAAAAKALKNSQTVKTRFLAARTFAEAGDFKQAQTLAAGLAKELQAESQAYAKIIEGVIWLQRGDAAGHQEPDRGEHPARHLDRSLRSGPSVS